MNEEQNIFMVSSAKDVIHVNMDTEVETDIDEAFGIGAI